MLHLHGQKSKVSHRWHSFSHYILVFLFCNFAAPVVRLHYTFKLTRNSLHHFRFVSCLYCNINAAMNEKNYKVNTIAKGQ